MIWWEKQQPAVWEPARQCFEARKRAFSFNKGSAHVSPWSLNRCCVTEDVVVIIVWNFLPVFIVHEIIRRRYYCGSFTTSHFLFNWRSNWVMSEQATGKYWYFSACRTFAYNLCFDLATWVLNIIAISHFLRQNTLYHRYITSTWCRVDASFTIQSIF